MSKNPKTPSTTIRFKRPFAQSMEFVTYFADTLPLTRLGDVVISCDIVYDPDPSHTRIPGDVWIVNAHNTLYGHREEMAGDSHASKYIAHLTLNQALMKTRRLTPPILRRLLQERLGDRACVMSSETNSIDWIVRIRFAQISEMMRVIGMNNDREAVLCHRVASTLLDTMALSGHPNVKSASVIEIDSEEMDDKLNIVRGKEYAVSTLGDCFVDCSASPCVNWEKTTSNHITDLLDILGVEGCTAQLFEQLNTVVSFDGTYIDPRHLTMLCNTMSRAGALMALNRHGINRSDTGPIGKCSFEETPDVLCDAAMFGECDNGKGVSAAIMTGQPAQIGSGCAEVLFHSDCIDPRNIKPTMRPKNKPWKSTCRSFTKTLDAETIEYVTQPRHIVPRSDAEFQRPFLEASELEDACPSTHEGVAVVDPIEDAVSLRVPFRPTSPVEEDGDSEEE